MTPARGVLGQSICVGAKGQNAGSSRRQIDPANSCGDNPVEPLYHRAGKHGLAAKRAYDYLSAVTYLSRARQSQLAVQEFGLFEFGSAANIAIHVCRPHPAAYTKSVTTTHVVAPSSAFQLEVATRFASRATSTNGASESRVRAGSKRRSAPG